MIDELEYGFRHDPMPFVTTDGSLTGARLRTFLLDEPRAGDDEIIRAAIDATVVFEGLGADGSGCGPDYEFRAENLLLLAELGAPREHLEIRRTLDLLDRLPERPREPIGGNALAALCRLGKAGHPTVRSSVRTSIENAARWIEPLSGCPWTPTAALQGLWAAREVEDTTPIVERGLRLIRERLDATGLLGFMDPWGFIACAADIDLPIAREILVAQIPMLLRAQRPDGGWGERTYEVFAALSRHGLLDALRAKPPLPADWKVARSIPAPPGDLWGFVLDGERFWIGTRAPDTTGESGDRSACEAAVAISPDDGSVVARIELPTGHGRWLGWWDGKLAVTQGRPASAPVPNAEDGNPRRLLRVDPQDGRVLCEVSLTKLERVGGVAQVDDQLWVFDAFFGSRYVLDAADPRPPQHTHDEGDLPCALPIAANAASDGAAWLVDAWSPWIVKTSADGELLDWAERPFDGYEGVAWDGELLWAIDAAGGRICALERTATAP